MRIVQASVADFAGGHVAGRVKPYRLEKADRP
jgi:hypothetical protein